jgi:tetratricopeptide (TPR) repeat protein
MFRPRAVFLPLALFFFGTLPCWSQNRPTTPQPTISTFSVRGTIRNGDTNQPQEMVHVELKLFTGEIVASGFTHSNGEFEFSGIRNGMYYLTVSVEGYEPIREPVEIYNFSKQGLQLFLHKPTMAPQPVVRSSVSAHLLSLPQKAVDSYEKGMQRLYDKNDALGSLPFFQRAAADAPSCYEAFYEIGVANARMGKPAEAESAFQKSVEVSQGRYVRAHIGLAAVLSNDNKYADAEPAARKAVDLDPTQWEGLFELARAQAGLNQWAAAEKSALATRQLNPGAAPLHLLLANIHIHKPDYPALIDDLEAYLKIEPDGASAAQARSTIEQVRKLMASAKATPPPAKQP